MLEMSSRRTKGPLKQARARHGITAKPAQVSNMQLIPEMDLINPTSVESRADKSDDHQVREFSSACPPGPFLDTNYFERKERA